MKLKIRGLVFAGFAAAVFAQSAMAESPADPAPGDDQTVTSKKYVDGLFNHPTGEVIIQGANRGTSTSKPIQDNPVYVNDGTGDYAANGTDHELTGEGTLVSGKAVAEALASVKAEAVNISADGTYLTVENVAASGNNPAGKRVKVITANLATANGNVTGTLADATAQGKLVTASAVNSLIDTGITTDDSANNTHMPTSAAVYNYAQPKVSATNDLQVGFYTGLGDAEWKTLRGSTSGTLASVNYVSVKEGEGVGGGGNGVYTVNLDSSVIADAASSIAAATGGLDGNNDPIAHNDYSDDLTTAWAVKEYVQSVTNGNTLPAMDDACKASGAHCALVSSVDNGNVTLSWTVMAQGSN